jgi:hypothetical protein
LREQGRRHRQSERLGCFQVDDKIELGRLQHWQIRRLFAFENATGVDAGIAVTFYDVRAIADQPATDGIFLAARARRAALLRLIRGSLV